jgi:outer membrane protein
MIEVKTSQPNQVRGHRMKREIRSQALRASTLALLTVLVGGGTAHAQIQLDTKASRPADEAPLQPRDGVIELSLDEAVELALRRNLGLVVERFTRTQAQLAIDQALGIYDLLASATLSAADQSSATISRLSASESNQQQWNFSLGQTIPTGGQVAVGFENTREESNNPFATVNPSFDSNLTFSFSQPLLRDFGRAPLERQLLLAQSQSRGGGREFERQVVASLQQVTNAYWALVEARQQLVVARESLGLATELHERNRIQVDVGTMAPLELVQSEAAIATREEDIIRSQQAVGDSEDTLRRLLNLPAGPLWEAEIRPMTDPEVERTALDVNTAINTAFQGRPEVRAQQLLIEQARINSAYFRNQKLPSLDLEVSYGYSGVGGNLIIRDDDTNEILQVVPGTYSDSLDQITGLDFDGWTAALTFGFPLQNRSARAASLSADLELERQETILADIEQQVTTEVRQAARQVDTAAKQIEAARASVGFQMRSLDAERKRYENGMSSSFEITRIQQDVTSAKSREVSAVIAYRTALTQFQQATGQLLPTYHVAIDDPEAPIDRWDFSFFGGGRRR